MFQLKEVSKLRFHVNRVEGNIFVMLKGITILRFQVS